MDHEELTRLADRVRRLRTGQTVLIDLRSDADPAKAASDAINAVQTVGRDVDEFVISSQQELDLFGGLGKAKALFGYPVRAIHVFEED